MKIMTLPGLSSANLNLLDESGDSHQRGGTHLKPANAKPLETQPANIAIETPKQISPQLSEALERVMNYYSDEFYAQKGWKRPEPVNTLADVFEKYNIK